MIQRLSLSGEPVLPQLMERFSGVGMIRGEFLLREHAAFFTSESTREAVYDYVRGTAEAFAPKPVWYRTSDLLTSEANGLKGIDFVRHETNPLLGTRGIRRALHSPDMFRAEVQLIASVSEDLPNVHLLLPFVGDAAEFCAALDLVSKSGWSGRVGAMLEVPSAIFDVAGLVAEGASNLMIGLNDLTCLILGRDRTLSDDDKCHPAIWRCVDEVRENIGATEWGVAGALTPGVIRRSEAAGVPYVSLHYFQIPDLLPGTWHLPARDHVRRIKRETRERTAALEVERAAALQKTRRGLGDRAI